MVVGPGVVRQTATHLMAPPLAALLGGLRVVQKVGQRVGLLGRPKAALRKAAILLMLSIILWVGALLTARQMRA